MGGASSSSAPPSPPPPPAAAAAAAAARGPFSPSSIPPSSPSSSSQWRLVVDDASDPDGWRYASVFKHLEYERQGGRASQRLGDLVRRRRWVREGGGGGSPSSSAASAAAAAAAEAAAAARAAAAASAAVFAADATAAAPGEPAATAAAAPGGGSSESARIRAADAARRLSALRAFVALLSATVSRRSLWSLLPLDPAAPVVLAPRHAAAMVSCAKEFRNCRAVLEEDAATAAENAANDNIDSSSSPSSTSTSSFPRAADLVLASLHSRAAYGYAAAAGHLASLTSYAKMHTVVRATEFDAASGASDAANNDGVARLVGGGFQAREDLLFSSWAASVSRPCHYVALDRASRRVVLSVRGSLAASDLLSNLSARPMEVSLLGVQGRAHEGMMRAATYVHCSTAAALERAAEMTAAIDAAEEETEEEEEEEREEKEIGGASLSPRSNPKKTERRKKPWPLLCVGHSMGGGVATLVATLLKEQQEAGTGPAAKLGPVSAIAIGPAAVLSAPLAERVSAFVTSVVLGADAVPRLSYASVEACLLELAAASPVRMAATELARAARSTAGGIGGLLATAGAELREILSGNNGGGGVGGGANGNNNITAISGASPSRSSPLVPSPPRKEGLGALSRKVAVERGSPRGSGGREDSAKGGGGGGGGGENGDDLNLDLGGDDDLDDATAAAAAAVATIAATSASSGAAAAAPAPLSTAEADAVIERRRAVRAASAGGGGGGANGSSRGARAGAAEAEAAAVAAVASYAAAAAAPAAAATTVTATPSRLPSPPPLELASSLSLDGTGDGVDEHPEPLLVAGRLLWILPPGELAAAAGGPSLEDAAAASAAAAAVAAASAARAVAQRADSEREKRREEEAEAEAAAWRNTATVLTPNAAAVAIPAGAPPAAAVPLPPPPLPRAARVPGVVRRMTAEGASNGTAAAAEATTRTTTTTSAPAAPLPPPKPAPLLLAPPAAAFVRLLLTPDALGDHLPDAYVAAVEQL